MPTDTILTIRCPHCMAGTDFRPMIAYKDGRFVCRDCCRSSNQHMNRQNATDAAGSEEQGAGANLCFPVYGVRQDF